MDIKGFKFAAVEAAIKKPGRLDLALIFSEVPATVAAVFTTNRVKAAPVLICQERVKNGTCQAVVVNSGNANACTGKQGMDDALATARAVAEGVGVPDEAVLVSSTGVIGQPLPMDRLSAGVPKLVEALGTGTLDAVANAIMTTDTFPKLEKRTGSAGGKTYTIAGVAKGAGMIMPNMATMLAFVVTDAAVEPAVLDKVFRRGVNVSFNAISVDGDTSTNDTAII
ncbi:MAG TPA: bifunctional ornithine acetyltransferase/N-acetylglutamate synthase, partial [Geobacteraceae bacterium]